MRFASLVAYDIGRMAYFELFEIGNVCSTLYVL